MKLLSVVLLSLCVSGFANAIYTGGTGVIVMGVAPYGGAPNVGGPTFIANNFTGNNDILTSPGLGTLGGYLTASPVIANNILSVGPMLRRSQRRKPAAGMPTAPLERARVTREEASPTLPWRTPDRVGAARRT